MFACTFAFDAGAAEKIIRYGGPNNLDTPAGMAQLIFKKTVEDKTNGAIEVQVFPSLQLGKIVEQIEGVRDGTQEMMNATPAWFNRFYSKIGVLDLPFLVTDWQEAERLVTAPAFDKLLAAAEKETGIKVLGALPTGFRNVINKKRPVNKMNDFPGLKLRMQDSPVHLAAFKALGASPIVISWAETYQAVQTGVVDGLENTLTELLSYKFYEVAPYISKTRHVLSVHLVYMNPKFYDGLTKDQQKAVDEGMRAMQIAIGVIAERAAITASRGLVQAGAKVNDVPGETLAAMKMAMKPVYEKFGKEFEPTLSELQKAVAGK